MQWQEASFGVMICHIFFILRGRRSGGYWSGDRDDERRETPMENLKRRYAKGEITCEDFERMKRDIES